MKEIYLPKQYFYTILILFSIISIALIQTFFYYYNFQSIIMIFLILLIFLVTIIFSYLSYKEKIPYLIVYDGNIYASKYQLIFSIIISIILLTIPFVVMTFEKSEEIYFSFFIILSTVIFIITFVYLSYKRKIPLLRMKFE